ncbi:MAG: alpha/beta fold hydrolase [Pyrinomonadaceae bacterium]
MTIFTLSPLTCSGFGYSDKPAWFEYSIVSQARVVERFMNRLGIGRATLVGSSYGGAVAATVALDYPEESKGSCWWALFVMMRQKLTESCAIAYNQRRWRDSLTHF